MNELDEIVNEFVIESFEGLELLDRELLALERNPSSPESLAAIFRAIHSIKGACGFLGFSTLENVAHTGENLLSRLRDGVIELTPEMASSLLDLSDTIREMLSAIEATGSDEGRDHSELISRLTDLNEGRVPAPPSAAPEPAPEEAPPDTTDEAATAATSDAADGAEPEPAEAAAGVAETTGKPVRKAVKRAPKKAAAKKAVLASSVRTPAAEAPASEPVSAPSGSYVLSDSSETAVGSTEPAAAAPAAKTAAPAQKAEPAAAKAAPAAPTEARRAADATIRVDVGLLDNLMTLVGELVLARNELVQLISGQSDGLLNAASQRLSLITSELQEGAMKTRMQPIGTVTGKLPRVVRDLAKSSGKSVQFNIEGEDTELDKSIIEAISDPLTHLVRNAIDHGIEAPDVRASLGKRPEAVVSLRAYHEGGKVNIEISDDGAGIDVERLKAKAIEKGIATYDRLAAMTERDLIEIIFAPGFSTAEKVTNVSGRGVGMDVVRSNIERIGGSVEAHTVLGQGTTFKVKIPLTLAIIPALFVESAGERFAIPQVNVSELVRLGPDEAEHRIESIHGAPVYRLRGRLLPLLYLRRELGQPPEDPTAGPRAVNIVVLQTDEQQFGMVVEGVSDSAEIVVKPLGPHLKAIDAYAGATIMGDGRVALILDVMGLATRADLLGGGAPRALAEATTDERVTDLHSLLLLNTADGGRLAIPLDDVDRLEKFPLEAVEAIGDHEVMQYRDVLLPLVRVSNVLVERRRASRGGEGEEDESVNVVVHRHGDRQVGIVVFKILDVVEEVMELEPATRPGVIGTMVIDGRATEVLDVEAMLHLAGGVPVGGRH